MSNSAEVRFTEHLLRGGYRYAYGLSGADINRDGRVDIVSADIAGEENRRLSTLYWFENEGGGRFREHVIFAGEPGWLERNACGDISGNGFADVVIVNNLRGEVIWFENDGQPGRGRWTRRMITTNAPRAYDVALADLDGDGRLDVAVTGYASGQVTWYRNPGPAGWDEEWPRFLIDERMTEARTMRAADMNGDGRIDLVCTAVGASGVPVPAAPGEHGSRVVWYENPGNPVDGKWIRHVVDEESRAPIHGQPVDLDGDGDVDLVMAFGMRVELVPADLHGVAWYENLGDGRAWKKHWIGPLPHAFEAIAADLDGDGQIEVIASAWAGGDRIVWFKHAGDPRGRWAMHELRGGWPAANQIIAADLSGQGRLDIAATADDGSKKVRGANELRWWRSEAAAGARAR